MKHYETFQSILKHYQTLWNISELILSLNIYSMQLQGVCMNFSRILCIKWWLYEHFWKKCSKFIIYCTTFKIDQFVSTFIYTLAFIPNIWPKPNHNSRFVKVIMAVLHSFIPPPFYKGGGVIFFKLRKRVWVSEFFSSKGGVSRQRGGGCPS